MSAFCANCGFPLAARSAFCPQCGARLMSQPPAPPPAAPVLQAAPVAAKSGSGLKVLMVIFGVIAVLGVVTVAGAIYVTHRVKQAVVNTARAHGVDLDRVAADIKSDADSSAAPVHLRPACEYLSKSEVAGLIGEPIDRAVAAEEGCEYFGPPGLAAKLGREGMSTGMKQMQGEKVPNAQLAEGLNNLINGIGAQSGEERPLLIMVVDPDGKGQMTALDIAGGLFGQIPGAKPEEISGLGDRAVRFANLGLNVTKGRTIVRIVAGPIPDPDAKTVAVAKAVLPRL